MGIKVIHLYTGSDGESHFEDIEMPFSISRRMGRQTETIKATGIHFIELDSDTVYDWHNASRRQFLIAIEGENEIETSDGTRRTLKPGDIFWAEDTTGKGHVTRSNNQPQKVIAVTLD